MNAQKTSSSASSTTSKDDLDKALEGTFPASDPVSVGSARKDREQRIEREEASKNKIPKVEIDEAAMPAEKPM